jgi:hypothetical protein
MDPTDDDVVAFLRERAPGLPAAPFDPGAVTARTRNAVRRQHNRRLATAITSAVAAVVVYLGLALAGPMLPGQVNVPGGQAIRSFVAGFVPGLPPAPDQRSGDIDRLDAYVLPVVLRFQLSYYLDEPACDILEYSHGHYADPQSCSDGMTPFDAQARADFDEVTAAVDRAGVRIQRIGWDPDGIKIELPDNSWQYNYEYVYLPYTDTPPAIRWPEEQWTHIRGHWWFHRAHDD